ncbi:MAG TPA: CCE_0567 family metalloprotein [Candidatus Paceibacterota bacterium]|nr:CCE_0567 family metalloprotein [Candidatus Paceibacterota bacterium]
METIETLKAEIKKLSGQAVQAKLDLHDLSEELPTNWECIPEVAQKTFQVYEKLIAAKQRLAEFGG